MNDISNYPTKRPSVKHVTKWDTIYTGEINNDRRGLYGGVVIVQRGYPFPDFYRVVTNMGKPNVTASKLFYGECAPMDVERYVYDLGFYSVLDI